MLARVVKKSGFYLGMVFICVFFLSPRGKQGPEPAHLLKNMYEEQEADEGDISDDEAEGSRRDSSPSGVRQRPVPSGASLEKS